MKRYSLISLIYSVLVFADWIFFGLGAASVFVLLRRMAHADRPYRVIGYPWLPALFVVAAAVGVASAFISAPRMSLLGVGMLVVGMGVWTVRSKQ